MKSSKRLFVAINLPQSAKDIISEKINKIAGDYPDIRWLGPENWHLTVTFLGWQPDSAIDKILESIKRTAKIFSAPEIEFKNIILAPPGKAPRMVWLAGAEKTSVIIGKIKDDLENLLIDAGVLFREETRKYNAHITLARFRDIDAQTTIEKLKMQLQGLALDLQIEFTAESLDLMESRLLRGRAEYDVLSRIKFK